MLGVDERTELQRLCRQELPGLYSLARRLGGVDAGELVQDTLERACRSFRSLRDPQAACKWLRTILTNIWRDRMRRDGRLPGEVPVEDERDFSLYRTLEEEDPLRYRAPLVLRYIEGFDTTEVATLLDLPDGTVMSQLHRGRQRFERELWSYARESGLVDGLAMTADRATEGTTP